MRVHRFLSLLLSLSCLLRPAALSSETVPTAAVSSPAGSALSVSAPSAVLMEKSTGTVLYEKNAHERLSPASVTKVMTMLLIAEDLESGKIALSDTVTASARAASFGGSCVYLEEGEQMSVSDMLKCIAVVSANDCAVAMAEHLSGTEEVFVERMNRRAEELGMEDTHFTNCTGLFDDEEHYTSAWDIALMSRELIGHEFIKDFTTIWMDSIRGGAFELSNTNKLVYWYPGCTGLKTGFTNRAMYCLAATAERDGVEFIAVILHGESIESRNADARALLNYAFANFALCPLLPEGGLPPLPVEEEPPEKPRLPPEPLEYPPPTWPPPPPPLPPTRPPPPPPEVPKPPLPMDASLLLRFGSGRLFRFQFRSRHGFAVAPDPLQVIPEPVFAREDVHHHVAVVEQHPASAAQAFVAAAGDAHLRHGLFSRIDQAVHMRGVLPVHDHEIIGQGGDAADVDDRDLLRLFFVQCLVEGQYLLSGAWFHSVSPFSGFFSFP